MIIRVHVKPGSVKEQIVRTGECEFVVSLKERAEDGKANARLINILAKIFGVGFREVVIKNPASHRKIIEIQGK